MIRGNIVSASAKVETYPSTFINRIIHAWEKTYKLTPLGREPRGAARIIRADILHELGGFRDVRAPDTDIDIRLKRKGFKSLYVEGVRVWHIREVTLGKVVKGQISSGIARFDLGIGFTRTLAHSIFRMRPLVVCGWLLEWWRYRSARAFRDVFK